MRKSLGSKSKEGREEPELCWHSALPSPEFSHQYHRETKIIDTLSLIFFSIKNDMKAWGSNLHLIFSTAQTLSFDKLSWTYTKI